MEGGGRGMKTQETAYPKISGFQYIDGMGPVEVERRLVDV